MNKRVLLSLVTWNHADSVNATLESISRQTYRDFKLVVLDNHSGDHTLEVLRDFQNRFSCDLDMEIVASNSNLGFCGGHNRVINDNRFEFLVLVNPDIVLDSKYLEKTIPVFDQDPAVGAVCGLLLQSEKANAPVDSAGMDILRNRRFVLRFHGLPVNNASMNSGYVSALDGALPAFREKAVRSIMIDNQFFNELFFAHKEDWDVSWRLLIAGWKTWYNAESTSIHPRKFQPKNLQLRLQLPGKVKYDGFKNHLLLLAINEDGYNFRRDFFHIAFHLTITTLFCVLLEQQSLKAYWYLLKNLKIIRHWRRAVQATRKISPAEFRSKYLTV